MTDNYIKKNNEDNNENLKRVVPVLSFEEFLKNEVAPRDKKIMGAIKIKAEDAKKAIDYFEKR